MDREIYNKIETFMLDMMNDFAHDSLHIYRVLHHALDISITHGEINRDVLIASCLLHDIGRNLQFQNPQLCHAVEGGKMAYAYMKKLGWSENLSAHVQSCITTHRFRIGNVPETIEAKILFDSDKLDVSGAIGIARSLIYRGQVGEPLYTVNDKRQIHDGANLADPESFFKEYHFKLTKVYDQFYTKEAAITAEKRKKIAVSFFAELQREVAIDNLNELLYL